MVKSPCSSASRPEALCECGCGAPAPIATRNRYDRGQRKGEPIRYISGHNSTPPTARPGPLNPGWKGDAAGYFAIHVWLNRNHPKNGACSECGKVGWTCWAFQRHPEPHTREINDYRELCGSCHSRFDRIAERGWETKRLAVR